jgi:hypothetical protein
MTAINPNVMVKSIPPNQPQSAIQPAQPERPTPLEQVYMQDVVFLLKTIFDREEEILKLILDCLYDVGSVNLINQRVHPRWLNELAQWAARFSKPVFRVFAIRWVKRKTPKLISDWLYTQIKFEPKQAIQMMEVAQVSASTDQPKPLLAGSVPDSPLTIHLDASEHSAYYPTVPTAVSSVTSSPVTGRNPAPDFPATKSVAAPTAVATAPAQLEVYQRELRSLQSRVKLLTTLLIGVTVTLGTGLAWSLSRGQIQTSGLNHPVSVELAAQKKLCLITPQACP